MDRYKFHWLRPDEVTDEILEFWNNAPTDFRLWIQQNTILTLVFGIVIGCIATITGLIASRFF